MSSKYIAQDGDTLRKVASKTLGSPFRWTEILNANPFLNDPARRARQESVGLPDREALFFKGEVLIIPDREKLIDSGFITNNKNEYRIILRGPGVVYEIKNCLELSEIRFMNTMIGGFSFLLPWQNPDPELLYLLREDGYYDAFLYIAGKLEYQAVIYDWTRETTDQGLTCRVWCYSPAADAVDSRVEPPLTYNNVTLKYLINDNITKPLSLPVEIKVKDETRFQQAQADNSETIAEFLQKYCAQRQVFLTSKSDGSIIVWRANTDSKSVGTIEEGEQLPVGFLYEYSGRKRFTSYKGITETPNGNIEAYVSDFRVPLTRKTTIAIETATTKAELEKAIIWHRNRVDAEAKKRIFPVVGLYAPDGNLWTENTIVTIKSKTMNAPDGFDFLIEGIERKWTAQGIITDLHIVDPISYSTGDFK